MKAIVLMPTFNEIDNLSKTVSELKKYCPDVDLLIIDDDSPDGTGQIADSLCDSKVFVMHRSGKAGLGSAYVAGFDWALSRSYELVIEMDADGSHRAQDLPKLIAMTDEADLVLGARWIPGGAVIGWPRYRNLISQFGNFYARILLRTKLKDMTSGFRVYRSTELRKIAYRQVAARGYAFQVEMALLAYRAGMKIVEAPITFVERTKGSSKMSTSIVFEAFWLVTKWAFYKSA